MNWLTCLDSRYSPPREEGWTRHQEKVAKPPLMERTGWSITIYVAVKAFRKMTCERPPRLRRQRGFATFSEWRSLPPHEEGNVASFGRSLFLLAFIDRYS